MEYTSNDGRIGKIKVLGVGGAGCNAINRMVNENIKEVTFTAVNTDLQVLQHSLADEKIVIGQRLTKGLGAGAKPQVGEEAAKESLDEIKKSVEDCDMIFITAGMGGGTGTGAAPVIAKCAKEAGALVVAIVTLPFDFEGKKRAIVAEQGVEELRKYVDTLLLISNSHIFDLIEKNTTVSEAFYQIDGVLKQAVEGISTIISETSVINVDFNDVQTVLQNKGDALMGIGIARGENRALEAAKMAIENPLIQNQNFTNAGSLLAKVIGGKDFSMAEFNTVSNAISSFCDDNADVIIGLDIDNEMEEDLKVVIVATQSTNKTKNNFNPNINNMEQVKSNTNPNEEVNPIASSFNAREEVSIHEERNENMDSHLPDFLQDMAQQIEETEKENLNTNTYNSANHYEQQNPYEANPTPESNWDNPYNTPSYPQQSRNENPTPVYEPYTSAPEEKKEDHYFDYPFKEGEDYETPAFLRKKRRYK